MTDIATLSLARPLPTLAGALGRSFSEYGFAVISDHGIPAELVARAEILAKAFFALPDAAKCGYRVVGGGGARGYTPFGIERAKGAKVHDLKEFWHVGRSLPEGHPLAGCMAANLWPAELHGFRDTFEALYAAFEEVGARVLEAIALHIGLPRDWFAGSVEDGDSVLRLLHYPPLSGDEAEGAVRAAPHGDINAITLLLGAEEAGLQLLTAQGEWRAIDVPDGAVVVNVGDMLDRLTNGRLRSTTHRVVNPGGEAARRSRYSMPFFLHFRPDFVIRPLASCVPPGEAAPPPISSHDFLQQRLREIGLA